MAIGRMPDGKRPTVQEYENGVAVWATSDEGAIGLTMSPAVAIETALRMLATASALQKHRPIPLPIRSVELLEATKVHEDMAARLVIDVDGAPLAIDIGAMNLAELAAGLAAASRKIG